MPRRQSHSKCRMERTIFKRKRNMPTPPRAPVWARFPRLAAPEAIWPGRITKHQEKQENQQIGTRGHPALDDSPQTFALSLKHQSLPAAQMSNCLKVKSHAVANSKLPQHAAYWAHPQGSQASTNNKSRSMKCGKCYADAGMSSLRHPWAPQLLPFPPNNHLV